MTAILLVEDNANQRLLYQWILESEGYTVAAVETGRPAIQRLARDHPDLVILGFEISNRDGKTVFEWMRDLNPWIPIIIHSGYEHPKNTFLSTPANAYVLKESDPKSLFGAIRRVLSICEMTGQVTWAPRLLGQSVR